MPLSLNSIEIVGGLGTGLVAALCTFFFTPVANRLATRVGAVDQPDHRKLHRSPTPRLGGASMLLGGVLGLAILLLLLAPERLAQLSLSSQLLGVAPGVLLIFLLGVADDVWGVSVGKKFLVQALAAGLVLVSCGAINTLNLPFLGSVELGWLGYGVSFLWLVGVTNAFNLIDGLDGLAAGVGSIVATSVAVVAFVRGDVATTLVAAAVAGACLGFLPHNWNPATTFMGDSGSLTIGFVLAVMAHNSSLKAATTVAVLVPVLALGLPAIDTLLVMGFRFVSSPDRRLTRRVVRMF
ncbi:MAG TPA: MraY family glycosyltransferase, partial [Thermoanaerobaculia bacterium]|nr:MraY family glycosyltransferase [Thermoanaerobaculia bacterium]